MISSRGQLPKKISDPSGEDFDWIMNSGNTLKVFEKDKEYGGGTRGKVKLKNLRIQDYNAGTGIAKLFITFERLVRREYNNDKKVREDYNIETSQSMNVYVHLDGTGKIDRCVSDDERFLEAACISLGGTYDMILAKCQSIKVSAIGANDAIKSLNTFSSAGNVHLEKELYVGAVSAFSGNDGYITAQAYLHASDRSLKNEIKTLKNANRKILKLSGKTFRWNNSGKKSIGLIAQEVEKVYPELVTTSPMTGIKSVQYANLVAPLIETIKYQERKITALEKLLKSLEKKIDKIYY